MPNYVTDVNWTAAGDAGNLVGIRAEIGGTARFAWGDGMIEPLSDRGDVAPRDGVPDPIFPDHEYAANGTYDLVVSADPGHGIVRLRAAVFADATDDLTLVGSGRRDAILGGSGDDRVQAGGEADLLAGNAGNDTLAGGAGNDSLSGGDGDDLLRGGAGNDEMIGGAGDDDLRGEGGGGHLSGGEGDDTLSAGPGTFGTYLFGDGGNDVIRGGAGYDVVSGGAGRDVMTGSGGSDTFWFSSLADGAVGGMRDVITDFDSTSGTDEDFLRLADVGDLRFITGRFHADGDGEVRAVAHADRTIVQVDADGNGTVDLEIALLGPQSLTASNFIL